MKKNLALQLLCYCLALMPLLILIRYVIRYGVDIPWIDQWVFVPLLEKFYQGHVTFYDLWQQHNEHRIFFPRIVFLVLARLTHWNIRYELAANVTTAIAILMVVAYQVMKTARAMGSRYLVWTVPLISLIVFTLAQYENWLWGWELQIFMNLLAVVAGIALMTSRPFKWSRLAFSMLLGIVATYSFANGIIYWPLGLLLLMFAGPESRKSKVTALSVWAVVGFLTLISYLYRYHSSGDLLLIFRKPFAYIEYVLLYLGGPCAVSGSTSLALLSGAMGLILAVIGIGLLLRRYEVRLHLLSPYIGLASYAVGSALLTGLGRIAIGSEQALATRYIAISSLLWIANIVFLCMLAERMGNKRWSSLPAAGILIIAILTGLMSATSVHIGETRHSDLAWVRVELVLLKDEDNVEAERHYVGLVNEYPIMAQRRLGVLKKYHLSLYRTNTKFTDAL